MERILFNDNWIFSRNTGNAMQTLMGGSGKEHPVTLPHDAALEFMRGPVKGMEQGGGSGNAYIHDEDCSYYKKFFVEKADHQKRYVLEFDGVYQNAFVYVNNAFAGKHAYGYGKFLIDITKFVKVGEENLVRVIVKSGLPSSRWYPGAGIYRNVYLLKADMLYMKEAGYNAIRSAHNPISRQMLAACDRLGMYIMDEFSDVWTSAKVGYDYSVHAADDWEYDIEQMVKKDYNHPSVILYSIGNEILETGNKFDVQFGRKLAEKIRSLDSTRYLTNGLNLMLSVMDRLPEVLGELVQPGEDINELMNKLGMNSQIVTGSDYAARATEEASSYLDVTGYNYSANRYTLDQEKYPDRIVMGSETYSSDLDINWPLVESIPQVIGDFNWTCLDYIGEAGIGQITYGEETLNFYGLYPWKLAYCGDIDLIGRRRPVSYWRERIWKKGLAPYIAVQPPCHFGEKKNISVWAFSDAVRSWNFAGQEGKPVAVEVYSDAEEIELLVNGRSAGRKKVGEEKKNLVVFEITYEPGKVQAIAYKEGKMVSEDCLETASDEVSLYTEISGEKLLTVDISLRDSEGRINPEQNRKLTVSCMGPGEVLGTGSANPISEERFRDHSFTTFEGCGRAYILRTGEGQIKVDVTMI